MSELTQSREPRPGQSTSANAEAQLTDSPTRYHVYVITDATDQITDILAISTTVTDVDALYPGQTVTQVLDAPFDKPACDRVVHTLKGAYGLAPVPIRLRHQTFFIDRHPPGDRNGWVPELGLAAQPRPLRK